MSVWLTLRNVFLYQKLDYGQNPWKIMSLSHAPLSETYRVVYWLQWASCRIIQIWNTECIKMIGAVSICQHGFENAYRSKFATWNETAGVQVSCSCAIPLPLFSLGLWRNTAIMATPEQKAFCVLQFVKNESFVSVQRAFRWQFNSDPPFSQ